MLAQLQVALVKVLLSFFLLSPPCQSQQQVVFDILQLNGRNASLNHSLPEGVYVVLKEGNRANEQVVAGAY